MRISSSNEARPVHSNVNMNSSCANGTAFAPAKALML